MRQLDSEPFTEGFNGRILPDYLSRSRLECASESVTASFGGRFQIGHGSNPSPNRSRQVSTALLRHPQRRRTPQKRAGARSKQR